MLSLDRTRTSSATTRPGQRTTTCSFKTSSATVGWHSAAFGVIGDMWGEGGGGLAHVRMVTDVCGKGACTCWDGHCINAKHRGE